MQHVKHWDGKDRCWSANSSGIHTVTSSVSSPFSYSGAFDEGELRLSELCSQTEAPTTRATFAPRLDGVGPEMVDALVRLAESTSTKLVTEATKYMHRANPQLDATQVSTEQNLEVFEICRPLVITPDPLIKPQPKKAKISFTRSLWNRLTKRRKRALSRARTASKARRLSRPQLPVPPQPAHVPRVFGLSTVHVSLDELLDVVGHRSAHATPLLHPSMNQTGLRHTLLDSADEHVCLRSATLRSSSPTLNQLRDFLLVEYHHSFETPTGRRGYAVACHSVHWDQCPSPWEGAVRGSLYESGLVALESEHDPDCVELFCVAEMNLKGKANETENFDASHHRVVGTLTRITQTIDERTKMLLSLDHTHVFQQVRKTLSQLPDATCSDCKKRLRKLKAGTEPYACRKCYVKVCEDCSSIWQRGQKPMRLCMECWSDAELNRTCGSSNRAPSECMRVLY